MVESGISTQRVTADPNAPALSQVGFEDSLQHWGTDAATGSSWGVEGRAAAFVKGFEVDTTRIIPDGFRRGRSAKWLPAQDWEALLPLPLEDVRARLGLGAPPVYTPVRTTQLRAQGLLS